VTATTRGRGRPCASNSSWMLASSSAGWAGSPTTTHSLWDRACPWTGPLARLSGCPRRPATIDSESNGGVAEEHHAVGRQGHALARAIKQHDAVLLLQPGDALGQPGLRDVQRPRRWTVATVRDDGDEVAQLLKGHEEGRKTMRRMRMAARTPRSVPPTFDMTILDRIHGVCRKDRAQPEWNKPGSVAAALCRVHSANDAASVEGPKGRGNSAPAQTLRSRPRSRAAPSAARWS